VMKPEARKVSSWASKLRMLQRDNSSAMGLPRGEITTAWPDSTASSRLERRALACAADTCEMVVDHSGALLRFHQQADWSSAAPENG
jgi:hypothetical protein